MTNNADRDSMPSVPVREQGTIKVSYTTAMILAGIIFLASLFSGWLTQSKDVTTVVSDQKALAARVESHSTRLTVLEQTVMNTKEDLGEIKQDMKDVSKAIVGLVLKLDSHDKSSKSIPKK
jgi:redox-regulated HSP33 family molecular chaperone